MNYTRKSRSVRKRGLRKLFPTSQKCYTIEFDIQWTYDESRLFPRHFFIKLKTKNAFEYQGFVLNLNNSLLLLVFVPESEVDPNFLFNSTSASRKMSM